MITSAHFGEATFENWESEFLQMGAYVLLTVLAAPAGLGGVQRASTATTPVDADPAGAPHRPRRALAGRGATGSPCRVPELPQPRRSSGSSARRGSSTAAPAPTRYSAEQVAHGEAPVSTWQFVRRAEFWFQSMQNWQSELLAVAAIVILTDLPAPAGLAGVQAQRVRPRRHRQRLSLEV